MLHRRLRRLAVALYALVLVHSLYAQSAPQGASTAPPADLDAYVANVMNTFEGPGIALAIVKDNKVLNAKAYRMREPGEPTLVDEHTKFGIGSSTNPFTAPALAAQLAV